MKNGEKAVENEKKKMVYISGQISGNKNYMKEFKAAEEYLESKGYIPINPTNNRGKDYKELIDRGMKQLMECDAIFMIGAYILSKGATLELQYAQTVGMEIIFQEGTQTYAKRPWE